VRRGPRGGALRLLFSLAFRADPVRATIVLVPFLAIAFGAMPALMRVLLDAVPADDRRRIVLAAIGIACTVTLAITVGFNQFKVRVRLGESIGYEIDRRLIAATTGVAGIEHFERPEHLDRLEVLRTERYALREAMTSVAYSIEAVAGVAVAVALLASVEPWLALLPLSAVPSLVLGGPAQRMVDDTTQAVAERNRRALHLFDVATTPAPAKELRVFGLRDDLVTRYRSEWTAADRAITAADMRAAGLRSLGTLCATAGYAGALVLLMHGTRSGALSPGDLFVALSVSTRLTDQLGRSATVLGSVRHARNVAERFVWISERAEVSAAPPDQQRDVPDRLDHGIDLDGVSFAYGGADGPSLRDVTLHLPAGTVVAIVGENGAGKSTLVKLLFGLYQPSAGEIRVDGTGLHRFATAAWRARTAACQQDHGRFELLAGEVVGIGDLPALDDEDAIRTAADRAAASDLLDGLPDGLATQVGAGGVDLSGGQWQKLAIARAMMRTTPLLLALDEPTSALDPLAEHELFERYAVAARERAAATGAITVLVSHRFSTVRIADLIVVLADGVLVEVGSHDALIAGDGLYRELYTLQASQYR
jgi:ATP-binding cassette, subfamily B, bacterial